MKKTTLFLFLCLTYGLFSQEISDSDRNALIALYNATDGENWTNTWDLNDSPTNWFGVTIAIYFVNGNQERHVDEIILTNNNLVGTIPEELGNLQDLNTLNLSQNQLSGSIPGSLGNAGDLNYLYLQENNLDSAIPTELFTLNERHFVEIDLSNNLLTGTLPIEISDAIANIGSVDVSNNLLSDLPDYRSFDLFRIETLDISYNAIPFAVFERTILPFDSVVETLEDNVTNLSYVPQNKINAEETITQDEGEDFTLTVTGLTSTNNTFQWFKNGVLLPGATDTTYIFTATDLGFEGIYSCEISNAEVPNLTLVRNDITVEITNAAPTERNALLALYNATDGPNWDTTWDTNAAISEWTGVTLDQDDKVISLVLVNNNLKGEIPEEIRNLSNLEELRLGFGQFPEFPEVLCELLNLKNLDLRSCGLSGSIPSKISQLTQLETLFLLFNDLTGEIPIEITTLSNLETLNLGSNDFSGEIPGEIGQLTNLKTLMLNFNDLGGSLPIELTDCINIEEVFISFNMLSGPLPAGMGNLTKLKRLHLSDNNLTGSILEITNVPSLESVILGNNEFEGEIPPEIGALTQLKDLSLTRNNFTGTIPTELWTITTLNSIGLSFNAIEGNIPKEIGNLSNLENLSIHNTNINGSLPVEIQNLKRLKFMFLFRNRLTGQIPVEIGMMDSLEEVWLNNNQLSGSIPIEILNPPNMKFLRIQNNHFVFDDFENNFSQLQGLDSFQYNPQGTIDEEETIALTDQPITLSVSATTSPNNFYQWRKDGIDINGANSSIYTIANPTTTDLGDYDCLVTNAIISDLELTRNTITISATLGLDDIIDINALTLYPNPATTSFSIALGNVSENEMQLEIYNLLGKLVYQNTMSSLSNQFDISRLSKGSYIIHLYDTLGASFTSRIMKK